MRTFVALSEPLDPTKPGCRSHSLYDLGANFAVALFLAALLQLPLALEALLTVVCAYLACYFLLPPNSEVMRRWDDTWASEVDAHYIARGKESFELREFSGAGDKRDGRRSKGFRPSKARIIKSRHK